MTDLELCNNALARLGEARIADLNAAEPVAEVCKAALAQAEEEVVRLHRWNFAQKRVALDEGDRQAAPAFGFTYSYGLPVDCVRVIEVNGISGAGEPGADWEVEGSLLLSNAATINLIYMHVPALTAWEALALECLTLLVGAKVAPLIQGGSSSKAQELKEELARATAPLAKRIDANESRRSAENMMEQMLMGSRALTARLGGGAL